MPNVTNCITHGGGGDELPLVGRLISSADQSGGSFELVEYTGPLQPPIHVHRNREEGFYILDGEFRFTLGTEEFDLAVGDFVLVPRGTRHGFTIKPGARALLLIAPAGLAGFFRELGTSIAAGKTSEGIRAALAGKYDSYPDPLAVRS